MRTDSPIDRWRARGRCGLFGAALAISALTAPAAAQQPDSTAAQQLADSTAQPAVTPASPANVIRAGEPRLVFEREVYSYPGRARRDPFRPLTGSAMGPLFEDLRINVILHSHNPAESVVHLSDGANKVYRLRRGDTVGNATVLDIGPSRVVFAVVDFGIRRQEVLELKPTREGA